MLKTSSNSELVSFASLIVKFKIMKNEFEILKTRLLDISGVGGLGERGGGVCNGQIFIVTL